MAVNSIPNQSRPRLTRTLVNSFFIFFGGSWRRLAAGGGSWQSLQAPVLKSFKTHATVADVKTSNLFIARNAVSKPGAVNRFVRKFLAAPCISKVPLCSPMQPGSLLSPGCPKDRATLAPCARESTTPLARPGLSVSSK
jgi:hypothetical protein